MLGAMAPKDEARRVFLMCRCIFEGMLLATGINYAVGSKAPLITTLRSLQY